MKKMRSLFVLIASLSMFACVPEEENNNDPVLVDPNNTAIISGSDIGANVSGNSFYCKSGSVILTQASTEFELGELTISRSYDGSNYVYWVLPVKNISGQSHAYIRINGITYLNSSNQQVYHDDIDYTYVVGSCGYSPTDFTTTFLRDEETGYFTGIDKVDFSLVSKISIASIEYSPSAYTISDIKIIPQSYSVSDGNLSVSVKNTSSIKAYVSMSRFIMLGSDGKPVHWNFLDVSTDYSISEIALTSGSSGDLYNSINFDGNCSKIQPFIDFDANTNAAKSGTIQGPMTEAKMVIMQHERDNSLNQRENALKN